MSYGETINVTFPRVRITGSGPGSESIDINPADATTFRYIGNKNGSRMVASKVQSAANAGGVKVPQVPVVSGTVTVTITSAAGAVSIYTMNGKNPTYKAISGGTKKIEDRARSKASLYTAPFTLELTAASSGRPSSSSSPTVLRIRSHKEVSGVISPNEKSAVVIAKFMTRP